MKVPEWIWKGIAKIISSPRIRELLIKRALKTPYFNLPGYMDRWWEFNPYDTETRIKKYPGLPSIRIHHILRADLARHPHDHPWNARTVILKGNYTERRFTVFPGNPKMAFKDYERNEGDTATINFNQYHSIERVSDGGVWTFFITYEYMGTWGFWVDGKKMPWRQYEQEYET
jgi:hypothetical protein